MCRSKSRDVVNGGQRGFDLLGGQKLPAFASRQRGCNFDRRPHQARISGSSPRTLSKGARVGSSIRSGMISDGSQNLTSARASSILGVSASDSKAAILVWNSAQ
jgi:hypothetical protein